MCFVLSTAVMRRMLIDKQMQNIANVDVSYVTGEWNMV